MKDLIDRQAALQAMETWDKFGCGSDGKLVRYDDNHYVPYVHYDDMVHAIKHLPSVQPEIIRCEECWRQDTDNVFRSMWCHEMRTFVKPHEFCSRAERRTDG